MKIVGNMRSLRHPLMLALLLVCAFCGAHAQLQRDDALKLDERPPKVLIALLVRNKAHLLPLFLTYLQAQDYPKERIALWLRSDHNSDKSGELLQAWLDHESSNYHSIDYHYDNTSAETPAQHPAERSPFDWPESRFKHLIALKEQALSYAERIWADYIFFLDADVILTVPNALSQLVSLRLPIVAPMLQSEGLYSNFWCGMSADYYYLRTDEYKAIYNFEKVGVFAVPMVHSAVLVRLNYERTRWLTFDKQKLHELQFELGAWAASEGHPMRTYNGPVDDIIVFAVAANSTGLSLYVSNEYVYGYVMPPLDADDKISQDHEQLVNLRVNIVHDRDEILPILPYLRANDTLPEPTKLGLQNIYMINLARRDARRLKMQQAFTQLGLTVELFSGIDGQSLDSAIVADLGISFLSGYEDPYHQRAMTMGEIGCFLSHYRIWQQVVERNEQAVLILEDDVRFEPYFRRNVELLLAEAKDVGEYDLIYLGRKRLKEATEPRVANTEHLVHAGYSYWTLGYIITRVGAQKLLDAKPLENLLPVDEFLPIMFNRHPNITWNAAYPKRNLIALSAAPLLLFPTHYTGEDGYISDTETSAEVEPAVAGPHGSAQLKSDRELVYQVTPENATAAAVGKHNDEL